MTALRFPAPCDLLSMNDRKGRAQWAHVAEWRAAAAWQWTLAHPGVGPSGRRAPHPAEVLVTLPFRSHRRRDPINYTPTVKAIVDGLTDAGAWPDDTPEYVTQHVPILSVTRQPHPEVLVVVQARR